jgi:hypothetical protein
MDGDQPVARPLPTHRTTQTTLIHTDVHASSGIWTHDARFRASERARTVHAWDRAAIATGWQSPSDDCKATKFWKRCLDRVRTTFTFLNVRRRKESSFKMSRYWVSYKEVIFLSQVLTFHNQKYIIGTLNNFIKYQNSRSDRRTFSTENILSVSHYLEFKCWC